MTTQLATYARVIASQKGGQPTLLRAVKPSWRLPWYTDTGLPWSQTAWIIASFGLFTPPGSSFALKACLGSQNGPSERRADFMVGSRTGPWRVPRNVRSHPSGPIQMHVLEQVWALWNGPLQRRGCPCCPCLARQRLRCCGYRPVPYNLECGVLRLVINLDGGCRGTCRVQNPGFEGSEIWRTRSEYRDFGTEVGFLHDSVCSGCWYLPVPYDIREWMSCSSTTISMGWWRLPVCRPA